MTVEGESLRFDVPLYTVAEAARYLGVPPSTFTTWAQGYTRTPRGRRVVRAGAVLTSVPAPPRHPKVPFIGLAEGMVAAAFREAGVSMQHLRRALEVLQREIGIEHALASQRLYTDGASILYDYATSEGDEQVLTRVVGQQRVFPEVVKRYLTLITFAPDGWAERLILPVTSRPILECDPHRGFGQPRFIRSGAPLGAVLDRFRAGESLAALAADFELPPEDLEDAVRVSLQAA